VVRGGFRGNIGAAFAMSEEPMPNLNAIRRQIEANIQKFGWAVQGVLPDDDTPSYSYTIGLTETFGHPELLMMGFSPDLMMQLLNLVGDLVKGGERFGDWSASDVVVRDFSVILRLVPHAVAEQWARAASERYRRQGKPWSLLQVFLPDQAGLFPWQLASMPDTRS